MSGLEEWTPWESGNSCYDLKAIDILCHFAAVMEVMAFLQKDMIMLRIFEVIAMSGMVVYMWHKTDGFVLDCKLLWSMVHLAVNGVKVSIFAWNYFSLSLSPEEKILHNGLFNIFTNTEMKSLQQNYRVRTFKPMDVLAEVGVLRFLRVCVCLCV